jgi:chromosomal replication initiator protein
LVEVAAPNAAQARYLETHCKSAFTEAAQAVTGRLVSVNFTSPESNDAASDTASGDAPRPGRRTSLNPSFTFDRFVKGPCNRLAHSAAVAVAEQPGEGYNPFFVYGAGGLGKTHLLQGIVHAAAARLGDDQCLYVPSRAFVDDAIRALENGREQEVREHYGAVGLLAVDDAHLLAGRERSQEEFFHILTLLFASQGQIVLAADRSPPQIVGLQERLASRFSAGLVVALDVPCLETRMAIVRDKATLLAIHLTEEIVRLVAKRCDADVRQLADALVRMDALSAFESSPITVELAKRAIEPHRVTSATKVIQDHALS